MSWTIGDEHEVRLRVRGSTEAHGQGTVVIEDLTDVLEGLTAREGANGPLAPVTQWILREAATQMARQLGQLADDDEPIDKRVIRILSAVVGHEPFATNTLGLSVHQMRRRWPIAADWYADLVRYVLRSRQSNLDWASKSELAHWLTLPVGELMKAAVATRNERYTRGDLIDLAETLHTLWPTYGPVQEATTRDEALLRDAWADIIPLILAHFGVRLRPGVTIGELLWGIRALASTQQRNARSVGESVLFDEITEDSPGGTDLPYAVRLAMIMLAGALEDLEGKGFTVEELYARMPVAEGSPLAAIA